MLADWMYLSRWIDSRAAVRADSLIQRRLAVIARDLGEYRLAADRFRPFVVKPLPVDESTAGVVVGATGRATSIGDVQQTANCLARAAQKDARDRAKSGNGRLADELRADLDLAIELGLTAVELLPDRESLGVLASAYKRASTVDAERRDAFIGEAVANYRRADEQDVASRFGAESALQLALIVGGDHGAWARQQLNGDASHAASNEAEQHDGPGRVDQRRGDPLDYWSRADVGDRALTRLMAAGDEAARELATRQMIVAYQRAFASRSTWAERQSPLDHLRDLTDLLSSGDPRLAHLRHARSELQQWEDIYVEEAGDDGDSTP
jgi:hypothetical protein